MLKWKNENRTGLNWLKAYLLVLLFAGVVACGPAPVTPTPGAINNTPVSSEDGYPPPQPSLMPDVAYPADDEPTGILFALDKPIVAGAESVSGVGPPGLTVYVMNVTFMGEQMGTAVVDDNGRFSVTVAPIPPSIRIGLTADIGTVGLTAEDIQPGDGEISIPQVGYYYDSFVISQN